MSPRGVRQRAMYFVSLDGDALLASVLMLLGRAFDVPVGNYAHDTGRRGSLRRIACVSAAGCPPTPVLLPRRKRMFLPKILRHKPLNHILVRLES